MRRDDESALLLFEAPQIVERGHLGGGCGEIEQQHVLALDRPLDPRYEHNSALYRVVTERRDVELAIVQGDGEGVISERGRTIDQIASCVRNAVDRIIGRVSVQLDFEHGNSRSMRARPQKK